MATIRKRGASYQIDYFDPNGMRVRQSFRKRKDAEAELAKRVSLIAENPKRYLEIAKSTTTTFDELVRKYKENFKQQRSFEKSKVFNIALLENEFKSCILGNISYYSLEAFRNTLKNTPTKHGTIRKDASVNRVMACLRHMFSKAVEWEMIERNPFEKGRSLQIKENNQRLRYLSEDEINRLLESCPVPAKRINCRNVEVIQTPQAVYLKDFIIIALNTGMRKGEILSLKWSQIRNGFIYLNKTKTDEARQIPVNSDLELCFKAMRKRREIRSDYLFPDECHIENSRDQQKREDRYIQDIKTSFNGALRRAGISDFRPHDLRHTFASHYIMRGGSLKALKEILGHKDIKMTMRYSHLSKEFAREEIQILNGLTMQASIDTTVTKVSHLNSQP
ncbi:MAG: site-specific integrase [Deltaproteobacteria bacterium]|nr:site-specific integrase [Deltaproteobacteria bacterium]